MGESLEAPPAQALGDDASTELLDSVGCGIWVYDGETILYVNKALEEITGYERHELLQPGFFERLIHPEDREMIVARGQARVRGEDVQDRYEVRVVPKDGAPRTLSIHARRLCLAGAPVSVVSAMDVTPLKEAEQTIRAGTTRVLAFLNAVPAHIIATDRRGKPTFVNRHWLEFTGQPREEAMARGTAPLIHPDDVEFTTAAWARARRRREAYEIEYRIRDRFGEYRWQMFRIQPVIADDDELVGWISASVDVHETRQLREQLHQAVDQLADAIASKDEVLGLISHELRTPLTTLLGNASFLQRHGEEMQADARGAVASDLAADARRLYAVIENMLVLSRMDAGAELETEPVRLNRLVETAVAEFRQRSPERAVRVAGPRSVPLVLANPTYYNQVLGNLLSNADKYSPLDKEIVVELREEGTMIETRVIDYGPGVPEDELDRVFAPFFRLKGHSTLTGSGLGLTVCRRLVELHGGTIKVENLAEGCCFSFTIPVPDLGAELDA